MKRYKQRYNQPRKTSKEQYEEDKLWLQRAFKRMDRLLSLAERDDYVPPDAKVSR